MYARQAWMAASASFPSTRELSERCWVPRDCALSLPGYWAWDSRLQPVSSNAKRNQLDADMGEALQARKIPVPGPMGRFSLLPEAPILSANQSIALSAQHPRSLPIAWVDASTDPLTMKVAGWASIEALIPLSQEHETRSCLGTDWIGPWIVVYEAHSQWDCWHPL